MHYNLILVGAHDGSKTQALIREASSKGKVLLVEPVPFLFARLQTSVKDIPDVVLANVCVSLVDGMVEFTAPTELANEVVPGSDQLGSLSRDHAVAHLAQLEEHFEVVPLESMTFESLLREYDVSSLDVLFTDTEGFDCDLLPTFPFQRIMPQTIFFEFKHSDGTFRVGPKLAALLLLLDDLGYDVSVVDAENMVATRRGVDSNSAAADPV